MDKLLKHKFKIIIHFISLQHLLEEVISKTFNNILFILLIYVVYIEAMIGDHSYFQTRKFKNTIKHFKRLVQYS